MKRTKLFVTLSAALAVAGGAAFALRTKPAASARPHAGGMPMIDTSLAAAAAARMLAFNKRAQHASSSSSDESKKEGSLVKQIKNELKKPHSAVVSDVLNESAPEGAPKPSAMPFDQQRQVGHNQTFSPDVTRSGVPRRTSG